MKSTIGVSTWSLQQLTYTRNTTVFDMIDMAAEMGADGIDICEEYIPCHPQADLRRIAEIRAKVESAGLYMGPSWFCTDIHRGLISSDEKTTLDIYEGNIQICKALGSKMMVIPFLPDKTWSKEKIKDEYRGFLEKFIPYAEKYDVPIAHECTHNSDILLDLVKEFDTKYYRICPDLDGWRRSTPDLPLTPRAADPSGKIVGPDPIEMFVDCVNYAPYIHMKLLKMENGEEPHYPIPEIMDAINNSAIDHMLCVEYEGWIPDIVPDRDALVETRKCVEMIKRYQKF